MRIFRTSGAGQIVATVRPGWISARGRVVYDEVDEAQGRVGQGLKFGSLPGGTYGRAKL